jgi:hypothetical protein
VGPAFLPSAASQNVSRIAVKSQQQGETMTNKVKPVWQVLLLALWINLSETVRWILYSKPKFEALYRSMGLELPDKPINGILWMIWGVMIAFLVFILSQKFTLLQTTIITWLAVFVMIWIALWNYAILPLDILLIAAPLSLLEILIAALISKKLQPQPST